MSSMFRLPCALWPFEVYCWLCASTWLYPLTSPAATGFCDAVVKESPVEMPFCVSEMFDSS